MTTNFIVPAPENQAHILLAEGDSAIRTAVHLALERHGFTATTVDDGFSALEVVREEEPDLVLLDFALPGVNGIDVCRKIRETSCVPILMMAAQEDNFDAVCGFEAGADDYVVKLCDRAVLVARARALLRRARFNSRPQRPWWLP
ncbi:response regulator [Streptomyces sp. NPDC002537]